MEQSTSFFFVYTCLREYTTFISRLYTVHYANTPHTMGAGMP